MHLQINVLNTVFESHVTMVSKFTEERQIILSEMCARVDMPEPNLLIICRDELNLFITFERLSKITYLSVSRVCSRYIMDGGRGGAQTGEGEVADAINRLCGPREHQTSMLPQHLLAFNPSDLV